MKPLNNEDDLIERAKAGQLPAFGQLIEHYQHMVFVIASRLLDSKQSAEDAVQDIFIKCFKRLSTFKQNSKFSSWLYRIAYNECIDVLKKENKYHFDDIASIQDKLTDHEMEEIDYDQETAVKRGLESLPDKYKLVLSMYYYQNCSYKDIAESVNESMANVKIMIFRAKKMLKNRLVKLPEFGA